MSTKDFKIPLETKKFLEEMLRQYKELVSFKSITSSDYLWYMSRRSFLLQMLAKLKKQEEAKE